MTTEQRIDRLWDIVQSKDSLFQEFIGKWDKNDLNQWIKQELGSITALDSFFQRSDRSPCILAKAIAPSCILHVVSGNTPHGALQSIFRGLVLGSRNFVKLPSSGLPEAYSFYEALPAELQSLVELKTTIPDSWWNNADAVIATGNNQTIREVHGKIHHSQIFIPHGHKISFALVESPSFLAARLAAQDISAFNQKGCLSPHAIYVKEGAQEFAAMISEELSKLEEHSPRGEISLSESGAITNLRDIYRYRSANSNHSRIWESNNDTSWTVIYEQDAKLQTSCLNRTIYVKPWPKQTKDLGEELQYLSSIALHPISETMIQSVDALSPSRICPLGKSQEPSIFWHHDGFAPLSSLVRWRDIEYNKKPPNL